MTTKDYLTIVISIVSLIFSSIVFFNNYISSKMKLGLNIQNFFSDDFNQLLFCKLSFINHSSKPITIKFIKIYDRAKKGFPSAGIDNFFDVESGETTTIKYQVRESSRNRLIEINEYSEVLPITLPPYSSFSGYFSFHFDNSDAFIAKNREELWFYFETTEGDFYHEAHPGIVMMEARNNSFFRESYKLYKKDDCVNEKNILI